jgi:hypothetical protein
VPEATALQAEIRDKQNEVSNYLSQLVPRGTALTYISIVCGALAVLLNLESVRALSQDSGNSASWLVPLLAAVLSTMATIAAALHKARVESLLPQLQKCAAGMDSLTVLLENHAVEEKAAAKEFAKYLEACPVVPRRRKNLAYDAVNGTIDSPEDDQTVQARFTAHGTVRDVGKHVRLWLAVEVGDEIWPKEGRVALDVRGDWSHTVFEDGAFEQFALSLFAVNREADQTLQAWLDRSIREGVYPAIRRPPGARRVHRVERLRRTA